MGQKLGHSLEDEIKCMEKLFLHEHAIPSMLVDDVRQEIALAVLEYHRFYPSRYTFTPLSTYQYVCSHAERFLLEEMMYEAEHHNRMGTYHLIILAKFEEDDNT